MTKIVIIMGESVISLTINHFGMNPLKGGSPPNDSSVRIKEFCGSIEGVMLVWDREEMLYVLINPTNLSRINL